MRAPLFVVVAHDGNLRTADDLITLHIKGKYLSTLEYLRVKCFLDGEFAYGVIARDFTAGSKPGHYSATFYVPNRLPEKANKEGPEELEVTVENGDGNEGSTVYP